MSRPTPISTALAVLVLHIGALAACTSTTPDSSSVATYDANTELAFCVSEVNRYRASINLSPLSRSSVLEAFAAQSAAFDAHANSAHAYFLSTDGNGASSAGTELLGWTNRSVHEVILEGTAVMWQQGPGGDHYTIITGPYTQIGCGISVQNGAVTVTQDFK